MIILDVGKRIMKTFNDIEDAYRRSRKAAWKFQNDVHAVGRHILASMREVGNIPNEHFFAYPPSKEEVNEESVFAPAGATEFNEDKDCFEFGTVMHLEFEANAFPKMFLRMTFEIRHQKEKIEIRFSNTNKSVFIEPKESEKTKEVFRQFAGDCLEAIYDYYDSMPDQWASTQGSKTMGFNPN